MDSNFNNELIRQDLQDLRDFLSPKAIGVPGFLPCPSRLSPPPADGGGQAECLERKINKIL